MSAQEPVVEKKNRSIQVTGRPWWHYVLAAMLGIALIVGIAYAGVQLWPHGQNVPVQASIAADAPAQVVTEPADRVVEKVIEAAPTLVPPTADSNAAPELYENEGGIPFNGTSISLDVSPKEVEVVTGGPMTINGRALPGGTDRGSVVIFLPGSSVTSYKATEVVSGSNWHGSYSFGRTPTEVDWRALAEDRIAAMKQSPNCSTGKGCQTIDVLIVGPSGIVADWSK